MECEICGKTFQKNSNSQKYCSKECYYIALRRKRRANYSLVKLCKYCKNYFIVEYPQQKCCSEQCKQYLLKEQTSFSSFKYYHKNKHLMSEKQRFGLGSGGLGMHMNQDLQKEKILIHKEKKRLKLL